MDGRNGQGGRAQEQRGGWDRAAAALLHALRRQETWAIEELMRRYRPALLALARRLRVPPEDRESTVLSVMDDVVLRLIAGATPKSLDAYVLRAFRNSAVLLPRRQRATQLALVAQHGEPRGDMLLLRETSSEYAVRAALGKVEDTSHPALDALARHLAADMSPAERMLLEWRAAGVPATQVAQWTGRSPSAVRVRAMRLRARLTRAAAAYCESLTGAERSTVEKFLTHVAADTAERCRESTQDSEGVNDE